MKKFSKILISLLIIIALLIPNAMQVNAAEGSGDSGWTSGGIIRLVEGANPAKSGWLISLAKEDGTPSKAVFVTTVKKPIFSTTGVPIDFSGLEGRFGAKPSKMILGAKWGFGPFSGSGANGRGNGRALKQWLLSEYKDGLYGYAYVLKTYFGYNDDQVARTPRSVSLRLI